jgi:hypothetical protein
VVGDFDPVRKNKSNDIINFTHMNAFNGWINKWGLIEINYPSISFSWSNKQGNPIMAKLDRIIASVEWNTIYPLAKVTKLQKGGSGHNTLRITFGENV